MRIYPAEETKYLINVFVANKSRSVGGSAARCETHLLIREGATLHDVVMGLAEAYLVRLLILVDNDGYKGLESSGMSRSSVETQREDLLIKARLLAKTG